MSPIRETYDLPKRVPVPFRHWALILGVLVVVLGLWYVLPKTPVVVALLAIVTLALVFTGVQRVLSSRTFNEAPGRRPAPPR
jgi:uncharacterized membrane protein HdeD (DUF308 family)